MKAFFRKLTFSFAAACLALTLGAAPVLADGPSSDVTPAPAPASETPATNPCGPAKVVHHKKKVSHAKKSSKKGHATKSKKSNCDVVRKAQEQLARLGYYTGKIDCKLGPQTIRAIKNFQRDHGLKPTGILDEATLRALEEAAAGVLGSRAVKEPFLTHDEVLIVDDSYHQDYEMPLTANIANRALYSRFARVTATESGNDGSKVYDVQVNGESILMAGSQPSVIGISKTYIMGDEDAIIFTTYNPESAVCAYEHYALVLTASGHKMLEIENCTRYYQAHVDKGSLYISFPEHDDGRTLGATWRLEGATMTRL